ncbi:DUF4232 domain-containing protein [Streptomyces rhizosphaerihabitans]|uniref:DUF4232 domain-containing protein n=1 Tax=Streptomyces rhizosphaerihabitans TaxID=1266770 RepID=UPI0021BE7E1F|nr:DUF4232 domain-containing protein [Streptomyces rhizosphaerihabitans]MCT9006069.1 DUF4232 domain-containing protein [Streptomyces rhizosphaerihabitans]
MARRTAAVIAVSLGVVLAAAACDAADHVATRTTTEPPRTTASASTGARRAAACGTRQLRWKLTRLTGNPRSASAALLSATNTGTAPCAFDGYPAVEVHAGKGPSVSSKPKAPAPVRHVLNPGRGIEFPLFYETSASPDGSCFLPAEDDASIDVRPPHPARNDYGTSIEMTDAHGRHLRAAVCGVVVQMGSPRLP